MTGTRDIGCPTSAIAGPPVDVLFCADRLFLQHAAVAALSVASATVARPIRVHVMSCDQDARAQAMLREALRPCAHVRVEFHRVEPGRLAGLFVDRHLTKEAYLRFLAPEVLPCHIHRVVYLDCDVIAIDDIGPLYDADLGGRAVGAVADSAWTDPESRGRLRALGLAAGQVYVNSGVLVMDLDRWRRDGLADRLLDFATEQGARLLRHDQDALNVVLRDEICLLDRRWNLQVMMLGRWARRALPDDHAATAGARRDPGILHFSTEEKPWRFRAWTRRKSLYFRFLDQTPWRKLRPAGLSLPQRLEYDLSRLVLRAGLDIYVLRGAWRRVARGIAARRARRGRARSVARPSFRP